MVIFNFRADRVVELSKALENKDFDNFDRKRWPDVRLYIMLCCTILLQHLPMLPDAS